MSHNHCGGLPANSTLQSFLEFDKAAKRVYSVETLQEEVDQLAQLFDLISPYLGGTALSITPFPILRFVPLQRFNSATDLAFDLKQN